MTLLDSRCKWTLSTRSDHGRVSRAIWTQLGMQEGSGCEASFSGDWKRGEHWAVDYFPRMASQVTDAAVPVVSCPAASTLRSCVGPFVTPGRVWMGR